MYVSESPVEFIQKMHFPDLFWEQAGMQAHIALTSSTGESIED